MVETKKKRKPKKKRKAYPVKLQSKDVVEIDSITLGYLMNMFRKGTMHWPIKYEVLKEAMVEVGTGKIISKGKNKGKEKTEKKYRCAHCENLFKKKGVEVDHIDEVGPFKGCLNDYARRMYCPKENLQVLCVFCHAKKTAEFNAVLNTKRKLRNIEDDELAIDEAIFLL